MTLITAWITPEFRIVASDSLLLDTDENPISFDCQKIFVNNKLAVGIYGSSIEKERTKIQNFFTENVNSNINELMEFVNQKEFSSKVKKGISNFIIIPNEGVPQIWHHQFGEDLIVYDLFDYMKLFQVLPDSEFFFSDQFLMNNEIDKEYHIQLFKYINQLLDEKCFDNNSEISKEIQILTKFYLEVINPDNKNLFRKSFGGKKIFFAYSYAQDDWQIRDHDVIECKPPITLEQLKNDLGNLF